MENWNIVYIDGQKTQPAGTFLIKNEDYYHTLKFYYRAEQSGEIERRNIKKSQITARSARKTRNRMRTIDRMSGNGTGLVKKRAVSRLRMEVFKLFMVNSPHYT